MLGFLTSLRSAPWFIKAGMVASKYRLYADTAMAVASLICVPGVAALGIYWMVQPAASTKLAANTPKLYSMAPGETTKVSPQLKIDTQSPKVVYKLQLVDAYGDIRYSYPDVVTEEGKLRIEDINVKLPATIKPGEYSLVANIQYLANPLKTNDVKVEIAQINVN